MYLMKSHATRNIMDILPRKGQHLSAQRIVDEEGQFIATDPENTRAISGLYGTKALCPGHISVSPMRVHVQRLEENLLFHYLLEHSHHIYAAMYRGER